MVSGVGESWEIHVNNDTLGCFWAYDPPPASLGPVTERAQGRRISLSFLPDTPEVTPGSGFNPLLTYTSTLVMYDVEKKKTLKFNLDLKKQTEVIILIFDCQKSQGHLASCPHLESFMDKVKETVRSVNISVLKVDPLPHWLSWLLLGLKALWATDEINRSFSLSLYSGNCAPTHVGARGETHVLYKSSMHS